MQFSLKAFLHPILSIMKALVTEPYSVTSHLHKLSSRQPEMLLENRLLLVCNIHEENQHGCQHTPEFNYSAKPLLWGEEPSFVHVYKPVVWAYFHLPETDFYAKTKIFYLFFYITYTYTVLFLCLLIASRCGESEGWFASNIQKDMQRMDTKMHTRWHILYNRIRKHTDITPQCQTLTSSHALHACLVFYCLHTALSFIPSLITIIKCFISITFPLT